MAAETVPVPAPDVQQVLAEFQSELPWHIGCSPGTAASSAYHFRQFMAGQREPFPDCFTYESVVVWLDHLRATPPRSRNKKTREASTVNGHLKSLKRFAKWAVSRGYLERNPLETLKGLREADRLILAPETEIVAAILKAADGYGSSPEMRARNRALVCVLVDIGPRAAEVCAMDVPDVRGPGGLIRSELVLHGKGSKDRVVAVNGPVAAALEQYLPLRRAHPGENALWLTDTGNRLTYPALRNTLRRICNQTIFKIGLHDFRRYAHTRMWLSNISQMSGMALSGHSRPETWQRYIRGGVQTRAIEDHRLVSPLEEIMRLEGAANG